MKTVSKIYIDFEKEQQWLSEMSAKGFHFIKYNPPCGYLFDTAAQEPYRYRLELLENSPDHPESRAYLDFIREMGVEVVHTHLRWVYLRKKVSDGPFEIYSDNESKIRHYMRISWFLGTLGLVNLVYGLTWLVKGLEQLFTTGASYYIFVSPFNLIIGLALVNLIISYQKKVWRLRKEKKIHE